MSPYNPPWFRGSLSPLTGANAGSVGTSPSSIARSVTSPYWLLATGSTAAWLAQAPTTTIAPAGPQTSGGQHRVAPVDVSVGPEFVRAQLKWLSAWVAGVSMPLSCDLIGCDSNRRPVQQLACRNARIGGLMFPGLDVRLRTPWRLGLSLVPEIVQSQPVGPGVTVAPLASLPATCSSFQFSLDGVQVPNVQQINISAMSAPGRLPAISLWVPIQQIPVFANWKNANKTGACVIAFLSPAGAPLLSLKFVAWPSWILYGAGAGGSPNPMMTAQVGLGVHLPSLA